MKTDADLWARIEALILDEWASQFAFTDRLARDNGWSRHFAERVVSEYKRFLYLSQVSAGIVTPSDQVDQAWHLHLTYSRHYWQVLCGDVLGRPLHHGPTLGGQQEDVRYRACYEQTVAAYAAEFGHVPPADIWPATDIRFSEAPAYRRINTARAWVIPRPRWLDRVGRRTRSVISGLAAIAGVAVLSASLAMADAGQANDDDLWIFGIAIGAFVLAMVFKTRNSGSKRPHRGKRKGGSGSGCSGCGAGGSNSGCGGSGCGGGGCGGD